MSKPTKHAISSVKRFGGIPEDYEPIHEFLDSSNAAIGDVRHRAITHTSWFIMQVLPRVKFHNSCLSTIDCRFPTIINSDGKHIHVRDIGYQHLLEDNHMKFVATAQDYLENLDIKPWMVNAMAGCPSSVYKIKEKVNAKIS